MPVTEAHPLSVHEVALNKLKRPPTTTTTLSPLVKELPKTTISPTKKQPIGITCKHFEFQCHSVGNEGGCIGIYNVCDGIPQCEDGSDEGSECPSSVIQTKTMKIEQPTYNANDVGTGSQSANLELPKVSYCIFI